MTITPATLITPATPTIPTPVSPLHMLTHKREAELCDGTFVRYQPVAPSERSRFSPSEPGSLVELGLGYVQAVLAALHGVVAGIACDAAAQSGRVALHSTGGGAIYHFAWRDAERLLLGGFVHSSGQPTYQAGVIALTQAFALTQRGALDQSQELVARWRHLLLAMDRVVPRSDARMPWERRAIAAACVHPETRPAIVAVCDALRVCLSFRLPSLADRAPGVIAGDVLAPETPLPISIPPALLLDPAALGAPLDAALVPATAPSPAITSIPPSPPARKRHTSRRTAEPTPSAPAMITPPAAPTSTPVPKRRTTRRTTPITPITPPAPPKPAPEPVTPAPSPQSVAAIGASTARIRRALARGGPLMLIGPTATGKTTQAITAAIALGFGVESVTLDPGWEADDLFGAYTRTARDDAWAFVPGPVTRWAEHALAGEPVVLLLDELARGHATVVSAVMRLLATHTRDAVLAMGLPAPAGEVGPFHLVDIRATQQRLVIPCSRVRIVATANQGEGYTGLDLADPAFGRRFTGGWLHLPGYAADETAQILGAHLGLDPSSPVIRAMQQVALQVLGYQQAEDTLRATLDLATLLAWGRATCDLAGETPTPDACRQAFLDAARDLWLDRLCPLHGALLDPDVERTLLGFVSAAAPQALR